MADDQFAKYENKMPYASRKKDPVARDAYDAEATRLHELFVEDLFEDLGIKNNPKRFKLFEIAWRDCHSNGYYAVWYQAGVLVELIE